MKKHFLNPLKIGLALAMTLAAGPTAPASGLYLVEVEY